MIDIPIDIAFPDGTSLHLAHDPDAPPLRPLSAVMQAPETQAVLKRLADERYPSAYYRHGNDVVEKDQAGEPVDAFLRSGDRADADEVIHGWVDEDDHYSRLCEDAQDDLKAVRKAIRKGLKAAFGDDAPGKHDIQNRLDEDFGTALRDADDSDPLDQLNVALDICVTYVAGVEDGSAVDDIYVQSFESSQVSATTVNADRAMENFLRFANLSSDDYVAHVLETTGVDLRDIRSEPGTPEYRRAYRRVASDAWKAFDVKADPSRPALLTADQVVEILDNASYGGVPVAYVQVDPKTFLELPWEKGAAGEAALKLSPNGREKAVLVGLHDFLNGSGHSVNVRQEVILPLDHRNWHVDGQRYGYGIDKTYGLVNSYFKVVPEVVAVDPAPEPEEAAGPRM